MYLRALPWALPVTATPREGPGPSDDTRDLRSPENGSQAAYASCPPNSRITHVVDRPPRPGHIGIEVKAAAYLQSWRTEKFSTIGFGGLRGRAWDPVTGFAPEPSSRADVYVFALLTTVDHALLDPLATEQWAFFVAPHAAVAARGVKRLSLTSVQQIANGPLRWDEIRQAVEAAAGFTDTPT